MSGAPWAGPLEQAAGRDSAMRRDRTRLELVSGERAADGEEVQRRSLHTKVEPLAIKVLSQKCWARLGRSNRSRSLNLILQHGKMAGRVVQSVHP